MQIIRYPSAILKQKSVAIEEVTPAIGELIKDMTEAMYEHKGKGLSAIQVGSPLRLFVVDIDDNPVAFVNPEIVYAEDITDGQEGCLSFPGRYANIKRHRIVSVRYHDMYMEEHTQLYQGFTARAIQHEMDHLDGKLMIDHMGTMTRRIFLEYMRKRKK